MSVVNLTNSRFTTNKDNECECMYIFFFQAEDGIRDLVRSRGLGDVYKRQPLYFWAKDQKPGDQTGQGVNNVWQVAKP